jgi:hypothetical protein
MLLMTTGLLVFGNWSSQAEGGSPTPEVKRDVYSMTPRQLADEGEKIIFGEYGQSKNPSAVGRGHCPLCHNFQQSYDPRDERAPSLFGIPHRALERLKDPRYHLGKPHERDTVQKEAYPGSGTATTGLEYITESLICPSCYVVAGFGLRGTNDKESPGVMIHRPPVSLTIHDLIAVTTWLYVREGLKPPSPQEIEAAYRKFIPESEWPRVNRK